MAELEYKQILAEKTRVEKRTDLPVDEAMTLLKTFRPLAEKVVESNRLTGQERAIFIGLGESVDGETRCITSSTGLTLEETFIHNGIEHTRNIFWTPEEPDHLEVYSMYKQGMGGVSRTILVPLNGDMNKLAIKADN